MVELQPSKLAMRVRFPPPASPGTVLLEIGDGMSYKFVDWDEIEPYRGTFRRIRRELGISAFGVNLHELPPYADDYPEHSETETNQEELYLCLEGGGTIIIDGDAVELKSGRCVFVTPESRRKIVAGADGLRCLAIGTPAGSYRGWESL
jgi:uncharacterized cupin superfamily protein